MHKTRKVSVEGHSHTPESLAEGEGDSCAKSIASYIYPCSFRATHCEWIIHADNSKLLEH